MSTILQWIRNTRCKISGPDKVQCYLGAPIGYQVKPLDLHNYFLDKINKRISRWSNKLLSFTGRVLLVTHVLQNIYTI